MTNNDPRRTAFDLAAAAVAAGLPIPQRIEVGDADCNRGDLTVHLGDDAQAAADRWAAWLGLPHPAAADYGPIPGQGRQFRPYRASTRDHETTGRKVTVQTYVTVPAPAEGVAQ